MDNFIKAGNGFNYVYERELEPRKEVIVKVPSVASNKRGVNDIGWQSDGDVTLYGTLAAMPEKDGTLWQEILVDDEVNKTVSAIKIVNNGNSKCRIIIRAIFC